MQAGRGVAACALLAIVLITVGWWALALYPVDVEAPTWVTRTRAACFGAVDDSLPSAGGWLLLVGEPIGMLGVLVAVWGEALRDDLRTLAARAWGRVAMLTLGIGVAGGAAAAAGRVHAALSTPTFESFSTRSAAGGPVFLDAPAPPLALTDQRGLPFSLASWRGQRVIVTFAFAHCADVCPTVVHQLREARDAAVGERIPLVVVTLDPWRDTPARLPSIAAQWALSPTDRLLSGSVDSVNRALDAWGVGRWRNPADGTVDHASVAYLVNARGRVVARLDGAFDRMRLLLSGEKAGGA